MMMKINRVTGLIVIILGLGMMRCEYEVAQPKWEEDYTSPPAPVIENVVPIDSAVAGDNYITLYGQNFASSLDNNHVYFDNVPVEIVDGNDTMLTVYRPDVVNDSIIIKLNSYEADVVAEFTSPYKVTAVMDRFGGFAENAEIAAMRFHNDILYIAMRSPVFIYQIDAQGLRTFIDTASVRAPKNILINADNEMVFFCDYRRIYKTNLNSTDLEVVEWIDTGSSTAHVVSGDYDQYGNFYFGGAKTDLRVVTTTEDSTGQSTGLYGTNEIFYLRIYGDFIYVIAANPDLGVWRHQLHSDGTVDAGVPLFSWANAGEFSGFIPNSLCLSDNGVLYIGMETEEEIESNGAILRYDTNADTFDILYKNIIPFYAVNLDWGPDQYLYMLLGGEEWNVLQIDMGAQTGAQ